MERTGAHLFYERLGYPCGKIQKRMIKKTGTKRTFCFLPVKSGMAQAGKVTAYESQGASKKAENGHSRRISVPEGRGYPSGRETCSRACRWIRPLSHRPDPGFHPGPGLPGRRDPASGPDRPDDSADSPGGLGEKPPFGRGSMERRQAEEMVLRHSGHRDLAAFDLDDRKSALDERLSRME